MHRRRLAPLLLVLAVLSALPGAARAAGADDAGLDRLAGLDRIATAIDVSRSRWPAGTATAGVLARSDAFPDALAGSPLAVARGGPLLLTPSGSLATTVADELKRAVRPGSTVYLLGGTAALGAGVESAVNAAGFRAQRVAGVDRYETATAIAAALGHRDTVLLADGTDFRDALVASSAAPEARGAVLLVSPGTVPPATASYLATHAPSRRFAVGAVAAAAAPSAEALVGADHAGTSVRVAKRFFRHPDRVGLATSGGFADALGRGAHIGSLPGPLLLVARDALPSSVETYLKDNAAAIDTVFVYGGTAAIADGPATRAAALAAGAPGFAPRLARTEWSYRQGDGVESPTVGEWPEADDRWFLSAVGTLRVAMLFVDFPDVAATRTTQEMGDRFVPLPEAWIDEASYGRMQLDITPFHTWYRMSRPVESYDVESCCAHQPVVDVVSEATELADDDVDFAQYDAVWVFGPETPKMTPLVFLAFPGAGVVRDGHELRHGVIANGSLNPDRPAFQAHGIVTHELGHLLGLPDTYGRPSLEVDTHDYVGGWEMMDLPDPGAHFLAFHKWLLGWIDPGQLRGLRRPGSVEAVISPLETPGGIKAIVVQTTPHTAYVAEVRRPIGEDDDTCDEGLLVYTVDSRTINGSGPARVKPSQPSPDAAKRERCGPLYAAPFDLGPGEVSTFTEGAIAIEVLEEIGTDLRVRATWSG